MQVAVLVRPHLESWSGQIPSLANGSMCMQDLLDAYFLKARGASDSHRDRDACKVLAGLISDLLQQLRGGLSGLPLQTVATVKAAKVSGGALGAANKRKEKRGELSVAASKADAAKATLSPGMQKRKRATSSMAAPTTDAAAKAQIGVKRRGKKGHKHRNAS